MVELHEITATLHSHLPALKQKYPIAQMAVFGSWARGEASITSDLDIMVAFDADLGWEFFDLATDLEQLLHLKVDLVSKRAIKPHYWEHIKEDLVYV